MLTQKVLDKIAELEDAARYVPEPVKELLLLIAGHHDDAQALSESDDPPPAPPAFDPQPIHDEIAQIKADMAKLSQPPAQMPPANDQTPPSDPPQNAA